MKVLDLIKESFYHPEAMMNKKKSPEAMMNKKKSCLSDEIVMNRKGLHLREGCKVSFAERYFAERKWNRRERRKIIRIIYDVFNRGRLVPQNR